MKQRLTEVEKDRTRERYAQDELFRAVAARGDELQYELSGFGMGTEEFYLETLDVLRRLTDPRADHLPRRADVQGLWRVKCNEYTAVARQGCYPRFCPEECHLMVAAVFAFATRALLSARKLPGRADLVCWLVSTAYLRCSEDYAEAYRKRLVYAMLLRLVDPPLTQGWLDDVFLSVEGFGLETDEERRRGPAKAAAQEAAGGQAAAQAERLGRGQKLKKLFKTEREKSQKVRQLKGYLSQHKLGSNKLVTDQGDTLFLTVKCFVAVWKDEGLLVEDFSGRSVFRLLTEDCGVVPGVAKKTFGNKFPKDITCKDCDLLTLKSVRDYILHNP